MRVHRLLSALLLLRPVNQLFYENTTDGAYATLFFAESLVYGVIGVVLGYFAAVIIVSGLVLAHAHAHNHSTAAAGDDAAHSTAPARVLTPQQATQHFPPEEIGKIRTITQDTLAMVQAGDQRGAVARVKDLETIWDKDQPTLQPRDATAWHFLDGQVDAVLTSVRAAKPNPTAQQYALQALLRTVAD